MKALHKLRWKLIRTHDRGHPKQAPITNPGHGAKRRGCAKFMESNALFRPRCKTASGLQRSASEVEVASGHTHRSRMANSMLVAGKVVKLQQRPITAGNCRHSSGILNSLYYNGPADPLLIDTRGSTRFEDNQVYDWDSTIGSYCNRIEGV